MKFIPGPVSPMDKEDTAMSNQTTERRTKSRPGSRPHWGDLESWVKRRGSTVHLIIEPGLGNQSDDLEPSAALTRESRVI